MLKTAKIQDIVKDVLTFLRLDYRDPSLITMYFVVLPRNRYSKNQTNRIILSHTKFVVQNGKK